MQRMEPGPNVLKKEKQGENSNDPPLSLLTDPPLSTSDSFLQHFLLTETCLAQSEAQETQGVNKLPMI